MTEDVHPDNATQPSTKITHLELRSSSSRPSQIPGSNNADVDMALMKQPSAIPSVGTGTSPWCDTAGENRSQHTTKRKPRPSPTKKGCCGSNSHKCSKCYPPHRVEKRYRNQKLSIVYRIDKIRSSPTSEDPVTMPTSTFSLSSLSSMQQQQYSSLDRFRDDEPSSIVAFGSGAGELNISQARRSREISLILAMQEARID